jgi:putative oxidoreductase
MNAFLSLGRWLYAIPLAIYGLMHFMYAESLAPMVVPDYMPARIFWVYLAGVALIVVSASILIGRYDKMATLLLAIFLLLIVLLVHGPSSLNYDQTQATVPHLLKDLMLAGAAMLYASGFAKDKTWVG